MTRLSSCLDKSRHSGHASSGDYDVQLTHVCMYLSFCSLPTSKVFKTLDGDQWHTLLRTYVVIHCIDETNSSFLFPIQQTLVTLPFLQQLPQGVCSAADACMCLLCDAIKYGIMPQCGLWAGDPPVFLLCCFYRCRGEQRTTTSSGATVDTKDKVKYRKKRICLHYVHC